MLPKLDRRPQTAITRGMTSNSVDPIVTATFEESGGTERLKSSRWNENLLKKLLIISLIISLILLIALLVQVFKSRSNSRSSHHETPTCRTKQCIFSAAALLETIDHDVKPCDDFYSFVCGKFLKDPRRNLDPFKVLHIQLYSAVRDFLEQPNSDTDLTAIAKARDAYKSCMNTTQIQETKLTVLSKYLEETLKGWPLVKGVDWAASTSGFHVEDTLALLERMNLQPTKLFSVGIINDFNARNETILSIDQYDASEQLRRRKRQISEKDTVAIVTILYLAKSMGNKDETKLLSDIKEVFTLKSELEKITTSAVDRKNFTLRNNRMTLTELHNFAPHLLNWERYFNKLFDGVTTISEDEEIIVQDKEFFHKLDDVWFRYSKLTFLNFAIWNAFVEPLTSYISSEEMNDRQLLSPTRWLTVCVPDIVETMPFAIGRLFITEYSNPSLLKSSLDLVHYLKTAYTEMIRDSSWLDQDTKNNAIEKLAAMTEFAGYPKWIEDNEALNQYYQDVEIDPDYVTTTINLHKIAALRQMAKFRTETEKSWSDEAGVVNVNAFYDPLSNSITFPMGIIQLPFFGNDRLAAINFGGVGSIIGHEIGHGFDNTGSQFSKDGELQSWWSETSQQEYEDRLQCYVKQYDNYCFSEHINKSTEGQSSCVDGSFTLGENTPDSTGVQAAFRAYRQWTNVHGKEKVLPGLDEFSPEQLFFISFAYIWCDGTNATEWFENHADDTHSPGRYRVQGSLANYAEFSRAFGCSEGSMNRGDKRCTLW